MIRLMKKKTVFLSALFFIICIIFYFINTSEITANISNNRSIPSFDYPGERILVVAPHPDDETLGAGGVIREAVKNKIPVKVVIFTSGESNKTAAYLNSKHPDPKPVDFYNLGVTRQSESIKAMNTLGLSRKNVIFLGFADGSTRYLWDIYWDTPRLSGSIQTLSCPYKSKVLRPQIIYEGHNVVNLFWSVLKSYKPTDIYYPDPYDDHPDHWAVSNFVKYTLLLHNVNTREHTYLVHYHGWPFSLSIQRDSDENVPADLKYQENFEYFKLTDSDINYKRAALMNYKSQLKVSRFFMTGFIRKSELFGYVPDVKVSDINKFPVNTDKYIASKASFINLYKKAGMKSMSVFQYKKRLNVNINTLEPVTKNVDYQLGLRIFYKNDRVKRLDLGTIKNNQIVYDRAENSITKKDVSKLSISKNSVLYQIAIPDVKNVRALFMGSQALDNGRLINRIPWKVYILSPQVQ